MPRFINFLSKYFPKKPESLPSAQALETFKFADQDFHTKKGKELLYTIFRRYPVIFHGVRLRASLAIPSIKINTDDPKAQKVIAKFLSNLHPTSGLTALTSFLRDLWVDTDVFGTSFLDPIWNKRHINYAGLKRIHPISIDLIREHGEKSKVKLDDKDNPVGWVQEINYKKKELTFKQIQHLSFTNVGDEILGLSTLEPIYKTTWRLMNIEEGIATAIFRHGFPLYDIQVAGGIEGKPPTKEQLDDAAKQVRGLNYKSEFIHPPNYKVKLLEAFSIGKGEDYTGNFIDSISSCLGIPKFMLLGTSKEVSRAVSESLLKVIKPSLKPSQDKLKLFFEEQILKPLMEANHIKEVPELEFGSWWLLEEEFKKEIEKEKEDEEKAPEENQESGVTGTDSLPPGWRDSKLVPKKKKKKIFIKAGDYTQEELNEEIGSQLEQLEQLEQSKKLPGLYIVQPHANLLYEGDKKQIIKSKHAAKILDKYIGKEMYLVSEDKVFGIIKLRKPREIDINEFIQLRYAHRVSDEERKEWWPKEKSLFAYEFDSQFFPKLKSFKVPKGPQILIKEVLPK